MVHCIQAGRGEELRLEFMVHRTANDVAFGLPAVLSFPVHFQNPPD
jgi:hypothetical protein